MTALKKSHALNPGTTTPTLLIFANLAFNSNLAYRNYQKLRENSRFVLRTQKILIAIDESSPFSYLPAALFKG